MQSANRYALKEWAVVCRALSEGRQTVLLRSGGIADDREGFAVEHDEFWLFATRFHQSSDELIEDAVPLLEAVGESPPPLGMVRLPLYATVERVFQLHNEQQLSHLDGLHILASQTVLNRFFYRRPGLTVLLVRAYQPPDAFDIPEAEHFAGCHSWVDLTSVLPTDGIKPVLSDEEFAAQQEAIERRLTMLN